ncbi:hypothetical protein [Rosettibacter firmus]|uniref:hypothetical protein n=1 Tax=Rosettibacter firmus TaxID=3111522 RepID=UPI00336C2A49
MEIIDIIFYGLKILTALLIMVIIISYFISKLKKEKNNENISGNKIKNTDPLPDYNKIYLHYKVDQFKPHEIKYEKPDYSDFNLRYITNKPVIIKKNNIYENNSSYSRTKARYTIINEELKSRSKSIINFY